MKKDILAPYSLSIKERYLFLSGKYVRTFLVMKFPPVIGFGFLSYYLQDPKIKVRIKTNSLKYDLTKPLKKEVIQKTQALNKETDPTAQARLAKELKEFQNHVQELVYSNDKIMDVFMTFTIEADTLDELEDLSIKLKTSLTQQGFVIDAITLMQEELFKLTSPLYINSGINDDLMYNYGIPVSTNAFATMWGYNFLSLRDKYGGYLGLELNNHGIVQFNPFLYLDDIEAAKEQNRIAGNIVVFGTTGTGKTTLIQKIARDLIKRKTRLVWIDPENKNIHTTKRFNGQFVHWGTAGNMINLFDLKAISSDEGEEDLNMYDTRIAINNVIDDFKRIMLFYHSHLQTDVSESLNEVDDLIIEMYHRKNIEYTTDFRKLKNTDYPILEELAIIIEEEIEKSKDNQYRYELLTRLQSYIKPLINSNGHFFNGHTTIKDSKILSFGTKALKDKPIGLRNALYYIMFKYSWNICTSNDRSAFIVDEAQELILEGEAAKELSTYSRRSRKYKNLFIYGSQDPSDLNSSVMVNGVEMKSYGTAIMNNSPYKFIMQLQKHAVDSIKELITLNDTEVFALDIAHKMMGQGDALMIAGSNKMMLHVSLTEKEKYEMENS